MTDITALIEDRCRDFAHEIVQLIRMQLLNAFDETQFPTTARLPQPKPPRSSIIAEAEARGAVWQQVVGSDGTFEVTEGEGYLFAIEGNKGGGGWIYFSDSIIWDAETPPQWSDGSHGWDIGPDLWFQPLPKPPA